MARYIAKHKDEPVTAVFLHSQEYKAKDGVIEVPNAHAPAHEAAARLGLKRAE